MSKPLNHLPDSLKYRDFPEAWARFTDKGRRELQCKRLACRNPWAWRCCVGPDHPFFISAKIIKQTMVRGGLRGGLR